MHPGRECPGTSPELQVIQRELAKSSPFHEPDLIIPILPMGRLRLGEIKWLAQGLLLVRNSAKSWLPSAHENLMPLPFRWALSTQILENKVLSIIFPCFIWHKRWDEFSWQHQASVKSAAPALAAPVVSVRLSRLPPLTGSELTWVTALWPLSWQPQ